MTSHTNIKISGPNPVFADSELILGLVAPVGTHFERFHDLLERQLRLFGYEANHVRLSDLTKNY